MKKINIGLMLLAFLLFTISCEDAVKKPWQGTTITSISPTEGQVGDEVIITGTNFKPINTNVVLFAENIPAKIISFSKTELVVQVPDSGVVTGPIQVRVGVNEIATSKETFTIDDSTPIILSMTPNYGLAGTEVEIKGANFAKEGNKVWFGNQPAKIIKEDSNYKLKVEIPQGLPDGEVDVIVESNGVKSEPYIFEVGIIFRDDFNRVGTQWIDANVLPNPIGKDWKIMGGAFQISGQTLASKSGGSILYWNTDAIMTSGDGLSYKYTAEFRVDIAAGTCFAGLIFNAQDTEKFYLLRINGDGLVQVLATADGGVNWPGVFYSDMHPVAGGDDFYKAEVASSTPGTFDIKIYDSKNKVLFEKQIIDPEARYSGGYAGFWTLDDHSQFDNFSLLLK